MFWIIGIIVVIFMTGINGTPVPIIIYKWIKKLLKNYNNLD